jgi:3-oxoacyl-[acyl-carrier protein] reductase
MFATERMRHLFKDNAPDLSPVSLRRVGDPAEFGRMAAILLSPAASYVTGAAIAIGGGRMTMM